jgi:hypothetical protein
MLLFASFQEEIIKINANNKGIRNNYRPRSLQHKTVNNKCNTPKGVYDAQFG